MMRWDCGFWERDLDVDAVQQVYGWSCKKCGRWRVCYSYLYLLVELASNLTSIVLLNMKS